MNILSIQSAVSYGHVGNSTAVPVMNRLGHEVWPLNTVEYSNHPGHGRWRGRANDSNHLRALLDGLEDIGALARCDGVLTGYLGTADNGLVALEAVERVRRARPDALFCCDPVIGNAHKGLFVPADVADFVCRRAVPEADIIAPNVFELAYLAGRDVHGADDARGAAAELRSQGPNLVIVTGLRLGNQIGTFAVGEDGDWLVETPYIENVAEDGAGDLLIALFLGWFLRERTVAPALEHAVAATFEVIEATREVDNDELCIVAAQNKLAEPTRRFKPTRLV